VSGPLRILATSDLGAATVPLRTSHGDSGTIAGVVAMLEREREQQPTVWLEVGDLVVGHPSFALLGERPWDDVADLPIAAAAAGNHDFDDGLEALQEAAGRLSYPLLAANVDAGLPATAMVDTAAGPLGVIGLTHPRVDELTSAPRPADDWHVPELARGLRAASARWVVALLHDGVEWWPDGEGIATRSTRLEAVASPWAAEVDLILGGHNFGAWTGHLAGTPAGEPHLFASSVVVADLGEEAIVRGVRRVPAVRPPRSSPAIEAVEAAGARVVGELSEQWLSRTGAERYLPDLMDAALRFATGADAGLVMPNFHGIQAPIDGAIAALGPGPVTELDLLRMAASEDYDPVVVSLRDGELERAIEAHWTVADPHNTAGDELPWNWCRLPLGVSRDARSPASVAVIPAVADHLSDWLDRDLAAEPGGVSAVDALAAGLDGGRVT